jgi:hypothetical protein
MRVSICKIERVKTLGMADFPSLFTEMKSITSCVGGGGVVCRRRSEQDTNSLDGSQTTSTRQHPTRMRQDP